MGRRKALRRDPDRARPSAAATARGQERRSPPAGRGSRFRRGPTIALRGLLVLVSSAGAVALFLLLLAAGEGLGWVPDHGPPPHFRRMLDLHGGAMSDARGRPLWTLETDLGELYGKPTADRLWLTKEKDPGVFRVLSIGESTTFGAGYHGEASYSRYLEARLRRLLARDTIEVVNCGKNGNDSHHWLTLVDELAEFRPDLLVVYVGHNEIKKPNLLGIVDPSKTRLRRSKTLRLLFGEARDDLENPPPIRAGPFLTAAQRAYAVELFEDGLRALLDFGRDHRVPVVVCIPASNVREYKPRCSIVQAGPDAERRLEEIAAAGTGADFGKLPELAAANAPPAERAAAEQKLDEIGRALAAEPGCALLHFRRGRWLFALGRADEARGAFARALELDDLPERASPDLVRRTRELARDYGVAVADAESRFAAEAERGIPGFDLFIDHCHPNLWGHFLIADELVLALRRSGALAPAADFVDSREPGATVRERFDRYDRELGISENRAATFLLEQARLCVGNLGTRTAPSPDEEWKMIEEFLKAAERQDPSLPPQSALFQVLRAVCRAARGDAEEARVRLAAARGIDAIETAGLADRMRQLPGLIEAFRRAGIEIARDGFR